MSLRPASYLFLLLIFLPEILFAQRKTLSKPLIQLEQLYIDPGVSLFPTPGGPGGHIGINFMLSNHWGFNSSIDVINFKASDLPLDYESGFCLFGPCYPEDEIRLYDFHLVHEWMTPNKHIRLGLEFGLSSMSFSRNSFYPDTSSKGWFYLGSNYTESLHTLNFLGASIGGRLQFPVRRFFAPEVSMVLDANSQRTLVRIELKTDLGMIRKASPEEKARRAQYKEGRKARHLKRLYKRYGFTNSPQ